MINVIETEKLTKQYGSTLAVDHIDMHVPQGKIYALLGRNGAGKTTLMKMLLNLVSASSGTFCLFGKPCGNEELSAYHRIGSIIETPGFYENLTAYENLHLLWRLRGKRKADDVFKALEIVGLHQEHTKTFSDYSLGMKQRLGIAAAMMHSPELLILDEPINGLDPIGISEIRNLLQSLSREQGTTVFISSHVLSEIEQIADVIGVMHQGCLVEEVTKEALDRRTRQYVEFEVSSTAMALSLLDQHYGITDHVATSNTVKVFDGNHRCGDINKTFVENGIAVTKIQPNKENLEEYFSELIGGGGIA